MTSKSVSSGSTGPSSSSSSSLPSGRLLVKRLVSSREREREDSRPSPKRHRSSITERLGLATGVGLRRRTASNPTPLSGSQLHGSSRISDSAITSTTIKLTKTPSVRFADQHARSGVFGYEGDQEGGAVGLSTRTRAKGRVSSSASSGRSTQGTAAATGGGVVKSTSMVADEYEYQTQRQQDIRSRLEVKESEKKARRGGPLVGRLAMHQVFGRLE